MSNGTSTAAKATNPLVGVLQVVVPAVAAYAVGKGWITESTASEIGAIIITIGGAVWSGFTTSVL
jgi:hypothetical protein